MRWKQTLHVKTRDPVFLWRMGLGIVAVGLMVGYLVQKDPQPNELMTTGITHVDTIVKETESAAQQGQWGDVWWGSGQIVWNRASHPGPVVLGLVTGVCWLLFVLQTLRVRSAFDLRLWVAIAGVILGALSLWPTRFLMFWQEKTWGLRESETLIGGLRYFILSVGLREEFAKLICLLPLMPVLMRLRSEFMALMASACVGLGFALGENMNYFQYSLGGDALGRFLTANPLHMAMAGLIGLAVFRGLRSPRDWGPHVLATFAMVVIAHGLYDAFGLVTGLQEYGLVAIIIFALVVRQFFQELREMRPEGGDPVSLTATFLFCVSLITSVTFVYLCRHLGWDTSLDLFVPEVLGLAIMVYLFLREMPERLTSV